MAINAKLVDTKPTIDEFKKLTECLDGVKNAFKGLDEAIPKSFADTISSYSKSVVTLTNTLDKMGQGFKNISNYADKAVTTLNNLTRSTDGGRSRFNTVLMQLEESLRGVDTAHIERVSTSLRRLGEALANLSRHGHNGVATLKDLGEGFRINEHLEDKIISTGYSPVSEYIKKLSNSFDVDFADFDVKTSGMGKVATVFASFSKGITMFNRDAEQLVEKLHDKQLMSDLKEGITSFVNNFKGISVELSSMKEVLREKGTDSYSISTNIFGFDGIVSLLKNTVSSMKNLISFVKSEDFVRFAYQAGSDIKEAVDSFLEPLKSIRTVFTTFKEVVKVPTEEGSTTVTTTDMQIDGILALMRGIVSSGNKLVEYVKSEDFVRFAYQAGSDIKEAVDSFLKPIADIHLVLTNVKEVTNTKSDDKSMSSTETTTTLAIDKIVTLMRSIVNSSKQLVDFVKSNDYIEFKNTAGKEIKGLISDFVDSFKNIRMSLQTFTTTIKSNNAIDDTSSAVSNLKIVSISIDQIALIMARVTSSIKRIVDLSKTPEIHNFKITMNPVVESIQGFVNRMNEISLNNSFAGFERLANAMYRIAVGAKSVVTGVDKAERAVRKYAETTGKAAKITNWFAGGWRSVVNAFTGGTVIYTIVRTIREAVDAFVEFDKKLRMINTLAGMSEKALSSLGSEIVATSGKFGLNLTQAADSMFAIQSATLRGADALRVFNASAMLSVAGNADLRNSTELITRSIMAYGKHTTEAQHIADVLFKTQDRGITTIEELAHNLTKVIPSAVAARVSFEEINAAMATLTTKGLQTTVASTALNSMLLKLTAGSEKLDAVFQKLGYDSSATALKQRGLEFVMRQISAATGGAAYELQKLGFNYRDIKAAAILANDTSGFFAETLRYINDEAEEGGKALQAYKEVSKSLGQQIAQIVATLKGAIVGISEFVAKWSGLKILLGVANWLTQVQSGLSSLAGIFKGAGGFILKFALGTGTLVASLTLLVGVLTKFKVAITGISLAKFAFKLDQVTNSSNLFMVGLKGLLGNLVTWIKTTKQASYHVDALSKAEEAYNKVKKQLGETIAKCTKEGQRYHHVALRAKRATDAWKASVVALKAAFWTLMKTTGILLLITCALEGLSWAWNKLSAAMDDKKAAKIRAEFSGMASEIDKLKTVTQVETRIDALSAQLEKLAAMSPTANVKALMKEYQTAIEKLNQKKMDMTNIQNAGESFEKLEEARKKLLMLDVNKMQQVNILKKENYELYKQLAMLPKASSAWAKMATKITNNTIKIRQLTNELRGMYDFVPNSLYSDVDNLYGDSLKGTSEKLKLKEDEIKTLLQKQGWDPAAITQALADSAFTSADFQKMQRSMQDAYDVRNSLVDRTQLAMGQGVTKTMATRFQGGVNTDLQSLGIKGVDQSVLTKHLPEVMNIIANLNNDIMTATSANLKGEDRINEAILLRKKELQAIVDIQSKFVDGNANATKEQKDALAVAKEQLKAYNERVNSLSKLKGIGKLLSNFGVTKWSESSQARLSVKSLYNTDGQFREILMKYLDTDKQSEFDSRLRDEGGNISYSKGLAAAVNKAINEYTNVTVGAIRSPLRTTSAQAKAVGSLNADKTANEAVLKLFKDWHELQLKSNKQYAEAYRKLYASSYDVYNSLRNASFGNLAGQIGSVNRDPMDLLREKILSPTGATSDAVAAAGKTLKQFGVFNGNNLDVSNANFRDAVTQAMISASSIGGEKGMQAFQQWLTAMQNLQGKMKELNDPYSKNQRKYIDAMGTPSEKMSLLKSDASKLNKLYASEMSKKMPDASLIENLQNAIWDNAVQQKQILASIPAGKPVPVSEQVSLASKEAYHLLQAQTTSNEGQKRMYTHVGDINANFKHFIKKFDRDSRAVYTAQKQEAVNMVVAVTP